MPNPDLTYHPFLTSQAVQANTGAPTAVRRANAIREASVNRPLVCASANPTTGVSSVSPPAPAALMDGATQRRARATVTLVGGQLHVVAHASVTQQRAVTRSLEAVYARQAGGAAAAASVASATPRPACRTLAAVSAWKAGGVQSVVTGAIVCEVNAALLLATAPALLASEESPASCPATLAATEHSAEKGKPATAR